MAKAKEAGLEHVKKLNIRAARESKDIYNELAVKYGQNMAREILDDIYGVDMVKEHQKIYEKKNSDYDVAMIFSGGFDADIVRKACNWIYEHQDMFGKEILEIGCDCGFMTTFLGSLFPYKHIVSIDRDNSGIAIARKNVERFGLTNVEFMCADAADLQGKTFDTVFSMRTMHENIESAGYVEDLYNELITQSDIYASQVQAYANCLSGLLKDKGKLVSIERLGRNALFLAWIQAMTNAGMKIDLEPFAELTCMEMGDTSTFEALTFSKEDSSDVDVFMSFMQCVADCMDLSMPLYEGWDAKIMYEFSGGQLVDGVEFVDTNSGAKSKAVCKIHNEDDSCILWYLNNNGNVRLEYHDISEKYDCIGAINHSVEEAEKINGMRVLRLKE